MKTFLTFLLSLIFCVHIYALTKDERIAKMKERYSYYEDMKPEDADETAYGNVYVTSDELKTRPGELEAFFKENPEARLIIDFEKGDGYVSENGTLTLHKSNIPGNIGISTGKNALKKLVISNVAKDITAIGDRFLTGCNHLDELDISALSKVTHVGKSFLYGCNLINFAQMGVVPEVVYRAYDESLDHQSND